MIRNQSAKGSENFSTALLLNITGGFLDAYTYYERGGVFANAQTGNIIKLGLRIGEGKYRDIPQFLIPICAFCIGVMAAKWIDYYMKKHDLHFIRRTVLGIEIVLLLIVSCLPENDISNLTACTIISFACAMQMEAFRTFGGYAIATTVGTGNLRQCMEHLFRFITEGDYSSLSVSVSFLMALLMFTSGVCLGAKCCEFFHGYVLVIPAGIDLVVIVLLSIWRKSSS